MEREKQGFLMVLVGAAYIALFSVGKIGEISSASPLVNFLLNLPIQLPGFLLTTCGGQLMSRASCSAHRVGLTIAGLIFIFGSIAALVVLGPHIF